MPRAARSTTPVRPPNDNSFYIFNVEARQSCASDADDALAHPRAPSHVRVCVFNVERGYKLRKITSYLKALDPDLILLQECDRGCKRTKNVDVAKSLGLALQMSVVWGREFKELDSPARSARLAGGGDHGNAILVRGSVVRGGRVVHEHSPYDWHNEGARLGEPRVGGRCFVWADVCLKRHDDLRMRAISMHLENFCGITDRILQFKEVLDFNENCEFPTAMGGDLNTLRHGMVKVLYPLITKSKDSWKTFFRSLGKREAEFFQQLVFDDPDMAEKLDVRHSGLASLNAGSKYEDAFDKRDDVTVSHVGGLYKGKLDWLFCSKNDLKFTHKHVGPTGLSDHMPIVGDFVLR